MPLSKEEITEIVRQVVREEVNARNEVSDDLVLRSVVTILTSFGMDEDERKEFKEDFRYLRKWRKGNEKIAGLGLTAIVTIIVGGLASAFYLGIKTMMGK